MLKPATPEEFLASPVGRYTQGPSHLAWCASPTLCGGAAWGSPQRAEVEQMIRLHFLFDGAGVQLPMDVIVDGSGIESIRAEAFDVYVRSVGPLVATFRQHIRRQALVLPGGIAGSIWAGFYRLVGPLFPHHQLFNERGAALDWLGADRVPLVQEALALVTTAHQAMAMEPLRRYLRAHHAHATIADAAAELGVSLRTLQRRLAHSHTSFRAELDDVRLDLAQRALSQGTQRVETIGRQTGFSTAAHFSAWFRRRTGMTPLDYRKRAPDGGTA